MNLKRVAGLLPRQVFKIVPDKTVASLTLNNHAARNRQRGFTLIELLAVVVILAILSSFALLNMNFDSRGKQLEELSRQMAALISLASDEAIYLQKELGLRFGEEDYGFYQLDKSPQETEGDEQQADSSQTEDAAKKKPQWREVTGDPRLRKRTLPEDIEIVLEISGIEIIIQEPTEEDREAGKVKPHLMMLSNGEIMPDFSITLLDELDDRAWIVASGTDVPVIVEQRD